LLSSGTVLVMGGNPIKNDVWKSADNGVSWSVVTLAAGWSGKFLSPNSAYAVAY
jgi:hypothetical protein